MNFKISDRVYLVSSQKKIQNHNNSSNARIIGEVVEELLKGFPKFLQKIKNRSVLIKPNVWHPHRQGSGSVTDARLVSELARCMLEGGASRVTVADGTAVGYAFPFSHSPKEAFVASGIGPLMKNMGVPVKDLNQGPFVEVKRNQFLVFSSLQVARLIWEHEIMLNVPVMKTHFRTRVTLGMKNLKGILSPRDKKNCHKLGLDEGIVDLNRVVQPDLVVIDGINGMEGLWSYPEDTVNRNMLIGADHPLHADIAGAASMGITPGKVRHIYLAYRNDLFQEDAMPLKQIIPISWVHAFKEPGEVLQERFPRTRLAIREACTGCYGAITAPLIKLYQENHANFLDDTVIISGPGEHGEVWPTSSSLYKRAILIGQCVSHLKKENTGYVGGCPPSHDQVMKKLTQ